MAAIKDVWRRDGLERVQDVEPYLEANKRRFNQGKQQGDFRCVASIPPIVIEKWLKEEGVNFFDKNDWPKVKRLLNSPEYRYLRTEPGKL